MTEHVREGPPTITVLAQPIEVVEARAAFVKADPEQAVGCVDYCAEKVTATESAYNSVSYSEVILILIREVGHLIGEHPPACAQSDVAIAVVSGGEVVNLDGGGSPFDVSDSACPAV